MSSHKINAQPRDLFDEAQAEYDDLQSLVSSYIFTGFVAIDSMVYNIFMYRNVWLGDAQIGFQQKSQTSSATLEKLKGLGESAGIDVTLCTESAQTLLTNLTPRLEDGLTECSDFTDNEAVIIQNDARYYIDTVMTEVELLGYQLKVCGNNFLCIEPILTQILEGKVTILHRVGVEFDKAKSLGEDLKILIKQCIYNKETQIIEESENIVDKANDCVNNLLGEFYLE